MTLILRYENNEQAAHSVSRYLDRERPSPQRFSVRPYNRFDAAFTSWWFIPSTDWPAFRHGKLTFDQGDRSRGLAEYMHVGYYIEHGYGKNAAEMAPRSQAMSDDWFWHRFIRAATSGQMDPAIAAIAQRTGRPVVVNIDAWAVNQPPDFDNPSVAPYDWYETAIAPPSAASGEEFQAGGRVFQPLRGSTSLADLARRIMALDGLDYFWINLTIGIRLPYGNLDTGTWGAAELWHNALDPWNPWVH